MRMIVLLWDAIFQLKISFRSNLFFVRIIVILNVAWVFEIPDSMMMEYVVCKAQPYSISVSYLFLLPSA